MVKRRRRAVEQWQAFVDEWAGAFDGVPPDPTTLVWCGLCEHWMKAGEWWLDADGFIECATPGCTGSLLNLDVRGRPSAWPRY